MMGPASKNTNNSMFARSGKGLLIILALVAAFGIYFYFHHTQQKNNQYKAPEQRAQSYSDQLLKSKDYDSYQTQRTSFANGYISTQKYGDAERVLKEITDNVPQDKITSETYRTYWYLYQQKGDAQNRKKYAKLTAEKLKLEGQDKAAAAFETDANSK